MDWDQLMNHSKRDWSKPFNAQYERECAGCGDTIETGEYEGCSETVIGWACRECCYDSGQPREDCPHGWDHTRTSQSSACRTTDILVAAARWFTA